MGRIPRAGPHLRQAGARDACGCLKCPRGSRRAGSFRLARRRRPARTGGAGGPTGPTRGFSRSGGAASSDRPAEPRPSPWPRVGCFRPRPCAGHRLSGGARAWASNGPRPCPERDRPALSRSNGGPCRAPSAMRHVIFGNPTIIYMGTVNSHAHLRVQCIGPRFALWIQWSLWDPVCGRPIVARVNCCSGSRPRQRSDLGFCSLACWDFTVVIGIICIFFKIASTTR